MPTSDLPADEQALWNAIAKAMANEAQDEPDVDAFLTALAEQA